MKTDEVDALLDRGRDGVIEWNHRRAEGESIPDLREVDCWGRQLEGINFDDLRILGGCFCEANLVKASFRRAKIFGARFDSANLRQACFVDADLRKARFGIFSMGLGHSSCKADLTGADFTRAWLNGADLSETIVNDARFCEADLTGADLSYSNIVDADLTNAIMPVLIRSPVPEVSNESVPIQFGEWLKAQCDAAGISPADLADQLGFAVSRADVRMWLQSKQDGVIPEIAARIARVFEIPVSDVPTRHLRP